ncbi:unnamed protein product [Calypogeia fissa]
MISDSFELDGSCEGSSAGFEEVWSTNEPSMKDGGEEKVAAIQQSSCSSADCASSTQLSSRAAAAAGTSSTSNSSGSSRSKGALTKKLLNSISTQFRRSLNSMGSARVFSEYGHKGRSISLLNRNSLESKVMQVIERVRSYGYSEEVCQDLRNHFQRLPARYTLNIDAQRHEDVLLHMNLLNDASKGEAPLRDNGSNGNYALPQMHVRKVQLVSSVSWFDTDDVGAFEGKRSIPIPRIPKPTFGSNPNLAGLLVGSPKVHPSNGVNRTQSTPPSLQITPKLETLPAFPESIPPPTFGAFINPLDMDDDSDQEDSYGYEITLATSDRRGLLKFFTNVLSHAPLQLNIREAHIFSTTDGLALEVFVVDGWTGKKPDDLRQAVLEALNNRLNPRLTAKAGMDVQLRTAVEGLAYEDWTINFENLQIGERLGGGCSGRLYKGKYLSQEVAIKIMELDDMNVENESGTLRTVPAAELLQMFKQEVSIMRLVRHKNLVQFIGACSNWPKLCIVTELMAGGSVRDVIQSKGTGLEMPAALKVLRDAARGMDFLHRRGIVHRDLKAANLLIDEHDVVKVCDFGVARLKPAVLSSFVAGNWTAEMTAETGTYRWMAPEVLEHKPYDHKADVYSFGIMIWEVVTGEVPYAGLTPLQAAIGVVQRNLRPTMPETAPPKLTALAEACWHQDPEQRPEFSEAVAILEELVKPAVVKKTLFGRKKF